MQVGDSSSVIAKVTEERDLGVICDSDLNFTSHINDCIRKANQRVGLIRRSFMYLDEKSFLMLYKTLVRPILEYCSSVWYPMFKKDSEALEKVQRRATKVLRNLRDLSYPERLFRLKLPSLVYRRRRSDLIQVYRVLHHIDDIDYTKFLKLTEGGQTRGHTLKLVKQREVSRLRQCALGIICVVNDWKSLDETVVISDSVNAFKTELEASWKEKDFKYDPTGYDGLPSVGGT